MVSKIFLIDFRKILKLQVNSKLQTKKFKKKTKISKKFKKRKIILKNL